MPAPPTERELLGESFRAWLGEDLFDERFEDSYRAAFAAVEEAGFGALPGEWTAAPRIRHLPLRWERFVAVADGAVRRWTAAHRPQAPARTAPWPAEGAAPKLKGAARARVGPRVAVNSATAAELATVPGIGPRVAARIVAARALAGALTSIDDLASVRGFSKDSREQAVTYLDFARPPAPAVLSDERLLGFGARPSFPDYVRHLLRTGLRRDAASSSWPAPIAAPTPAGLAVRELSALAAEARSAPSWNPPRRCDVPQLERATRAKMRADGLRARGTVEDVGAVGVVRNAAYLDVVLELIGAAGSRVFVEAFFFTSEGDGPGAKLVAALAAAKARGVDVRLIVDTDLVGDVHGALEVNEETLGRLRAAKVPFRLDAIGTTSHSKTVIVDDDRLLTGSHNWTTHAIYLLDETSLYVESAALAARAATRFEHLWRAYDTSASRRTIDLSLVRLPSAAERPALAALGLADSRALLAEAPSAASAKRLAKRLGLDPGRLVRLRAVLSLMQELGLPEPTAYALAEVGLATPAAVRRVSRKRLLALIDGLGPLGEPYRGCPVRLDAVEAVRA